MGHTIISPRPALAPLTTSADWVPSLAGITIPDVRVAVFESNAQPKAKPLAERRGSFLFTHFGLSGPAPMDVSRTVTAHPRPSEHVLAVDILPEFSHADLERDIRTTCERHGKRSALSLVPEAVPRRLATVLLERAGISPEKRLAELSTAKRAELVRQLRRCPIPLTGTRGFAKAEVTAGGVALDEVDSRTMYSKLVPGLSLAGEILDLDGPIGGYNFQAAFSTGWLAGMHA
jgi:predicted Rossmann fold flavoprotein